MEANIAAAKSNQNLKISIILFVTVMFKNYKNNIVQQLRNKVTTGNDATGVEDNKPNDVRKSEDQANQTGKLLKTDNSSISYPEPGKPGAVEQTKKQKKQLKKQVQ